MDRLLITNAHLLEPASGELTDAGWLAAADGLHPATGTGRAPAAGEGVRHIDAGGATVLPGLIDAHVHLMLTTFDNVEAATWTPGYAAARALAEAGRVLRRGFTTVRDVGGADYGLARALAEGLADGPRLVYGGKALSQTGGHGDLRPLGAEAPPCCEHHASFGRIADGVDAVRAAARDELRKGAAHLKLCVSGGVASPHDEISAVQYSDEEIRAAVVEAEHQNRYVTVHAYHSRAVNHALREGVRCVEHGNLIDDETIGLLRERDAYLVPTLVTYDQMAKFGKQAGVPEGSLRKLAEVREAGLGALERAHRAGVNLVYGSDLIGPLQNAQLEEFALRAEVQPPADILRAATTTAARLLNLEGRIGTLAAGAHADLLVVDGNPLDDIRILTRPEQKLRQVIKAGAVVQRG